MVTIRLHGVLARLAGCDRLTLETSAGTAGAVVEEIAARWPQLAAELRRTACAIGDELVSRSARLAPGAELNLLPPVSGG